MGPVGNEVRTGKRRVASILTALWLAVAMHPATVRPTRVGGPRTLDIFT